MEKLRVLYAASEISPFLSTSKVGSFVKGLTQYVHKKELDLRILVPKFGLINERTNRLHEVVRLSRINIKVGTREQPLMIKVASIPDSRIQVYFVDNEEYFKRKAVFHDKNNAFFEDNDERTIFFCKSVLETVKQLGWKPDIIHCHDWITSFIPCYLKTFYCQDPIFQKSCVVFTLYNHALADQFDQKFIEKALIPQPSTDFSGLVQTGIKYADVAVRPVILQEQPLNGLLKAGNVTCIEHDEAGLETYYNLYQKLAASR